MARKHDRRNEPRPDLRPLCPFAGFKPCRGGDCMVWDDDCQVCSLNNGSMYSTVRCAVCDAAVEVIGEYRREGDRATSSVSGCAGAAFPDAKPVLQGKGEGKDDGEAGA